MICKNLIKIETIGFHKPGVEDQVTYFRDIFRYIPNTEVGKVSIFKVNGKRMISHFERETYSSPKKT